MWKDQFDWVYREMDYAVFAFTIHPDVSGRPQVLMMLERLIQYINCHPATEWMTFDEIANGTYSVSRALYFYVKHAHMGVVPGLKEYMAEWVKHWGEDGALSDSGMIPMPTAERNAFKAAMTDLPVLTADMLK